MRTAVTMALTHTGEWKLISDPSVAMVDQFNAFRMARVNVSHDELQLLTYQESDGERQEIRFRSPDAHKEHLARRKMEMCEAEKIAAQDKAKTEKRQKDIVKERDDAHQAEIKAHDKKALADPNRTAGGKPK